MAKIYTRLRGNETDGETHLYELFAEKLSSQFHVWHNFVEPRTHKEIDFGVLHPKYGMWVMEVKDWLIHQIRRVDPENCRVVLNDQEVEVRNPIRQARENHYPIRNLLMEEKSLLHPSGKFEGNLLFPVHHIVVFSNISREEMESRGIYALFPAHQIITADEIRDPELDEIALEDLLIKKRSPRFLNHQGLDDDQIAAIDRILNPQVVVELPPEETVSEAASGRATAPEAETDLTELPPQEEPSPVPPQVEEREVLIFHPPADSPEREETPATTAEREETPSETAATVEREETPPETAEGETQPETPDIVPEGTPPLRETPRNPDAASLRTGDEPSATNKTTELHRVLRRIIHHNNELLQRMWSKS